jgi:hypothetical protein
VVTGRKEGEQERVNHPNHHPPGSASRASLDGWFKEVDVLLAEQREFSISPSECDEEPEDGVTKWSITFRELKKSIGPLLTRLTNDPGRWILIVEIDEAHDHFLRFVAYEDGSLVVETLGNKYLQGAYLLSEAQMTGLAVIGWQEPVVGGRATWAFTEATQSPEIDEVSDLVITTLRRVFKSVVTDRFLLKLSSVPDRGETAASEHPLSPELSDEIPTEDGRWLSSPPTPSTPPTESWRAYYEVLYPEPTRPISAFGQWKRATTCTNLTRDLWEARERARQSWVAEPRTVEEQQLDHPPVVLWLPMVANAACLGCVWIGKGSSSVEGAAQRARNHSVDRGDDPAVVSRLPVPISARNGQGDEPLDRSWVEPQRFGTREELLTIGPRWEHYDISGLGTVASASVSLDRPDTDAEADPTRLSLAIDIEENWDGYIWRCDIEDQVDGYEAGEMGRGGAVSVDQAEIDCWDFVVDLLQALDYSDDEIIRSHTGVCGGEMVAQ